MSNLTRRLRYLSEPGTWTAMARYAPWYVSGPCPFPSPRPDSQERPLVRWPIEYQTPFATMFVGALKTGFEAATTVTHAHIPQPYWGIVIVEIDHGDGARRVAFDWEDDPALTAECVAEVDVYFKLQYQRGGYPELTNVKPGTYVTDSPFLYANWCRLRALRKAALPTSDVFARFGLRSSAEIREDAMRRLRADPRIDFSGGARSTHYPRYLREMARARVCVDVPGRGPWCMRLIECLAMGCCVVSRRHDAEMPVHLRDGVEVVYCREDLGDLADLCVEYARDAELRAPVEAAAARYFDEHLHPLRMAEHYLRESRVKPGSATF